MWRRAWCSALLMAAGAGCGSGKGAAPSDGGGGSGGGHDGAVADAPGGTDAPPDGTGFEPFVPDYFDGGCSFFGGAGEVPAQGSPFHGLTVVATGLTGMTALEVDATNAYLAGASSISRLPLAGGAAQVMTMNAMPVAMAIDDSNVYWSDAGVSGQTTIQSVPLTATNATTTTMLAQKPGAPGAFTMAGGYLYFTAGTVVWRVATTGGGAAQMVYSGLAPTGIAVDGANVYLGDDPNEAIQFVMTSGQFAGVLQGFTFSNATPTQLAISNGNLYWGDWFGAIEHAPVTNANALDYARTPCGGGGCYPNHLRPAGSVVVWEAGDDSCSSVGKVDATGSTYFATNVAAVGGIAVSGNHFYAVTAVGQLLRFDL